jgi:hypothetical protein
MFLACTLLEVACYFRINALHNFQQSSFECASSLFVDSYHFFHFSLSEHCPYVLTNTCEIFLAAPFAPDFSISVWIKVNVIGERSNGPVKFLVIPLKVINQILNADLHKEVITIVTHGFQLFK